MKPTGPPVHHLPSSSLAAILLLLLVPIVRLEGNKAFQPIDYPIPTETVRGDGFSNSNSPDLLPGVGEADNVREFDSTLPIRSSIESVWTVLTDYDHIEDFQPGIEQSSLLETLPNGEKKIEQQMVQRFLFFKKRLHLVVRIIEKPPHRIEFSIIDGDFKCYDGAWVIDPESSIPQLRLALRVEPNFPAPGPVLDYMVRSSSEKSLLSVIKEAERREKDRG